MTVTISSPFRLSVKAPAGGQNWAQRSTAPGVVRRFGFDSAAELGPNDVSAPNQDFGTTSARAGPTSVTWDGTMSAPGSAGSVLFNIPGPSGAPSYAWFTNFSPPPYPTQFGENSEFFIQWRQRFNQAWIDEVLYQRSTTWEPSFDLPRDFLVQPTSIWTGFRYKVVSPGVTGTSEPTWPTTLSGTVVDGGVTFQAVRWTTTTSEKQCIIAVGDKPGLAPAHSCTELELVVQDYGMSKFPINYHSCTGCWIAPGNFQGGFNGFYEGVGGDFRLQNKMPSPFCLFSNPGPGCFKWVGDEWMTFQVGVTVGSLTNSGASGSGTNWHWANSRVRFWVQREGQPSVLVSDWPPPGKTFVLCAGAQTLAENPDPRFVQQKYGKIWLTPFMTNKQQHQPHATLNTWYTQLIISTRKIADAA